MLNQDTPNILTRFNNAGKTGHERPMPLPDTGKLARKRSVGYIPSIGVLGAINNPDKNVLDEAPSFYLDDSELFDESAFIGGVESFFGNLNFRQSKPALQNAIRKASQFKVLGLAKKLADYHANDSYIGVADIEATAKELQNFDAFTRSLTPNEALEFSNFLGLDKAFKAIGKAVGSAGKAVGKAVGAAGKAVGTAAAAAGKGVIKGVTGAAKGVANAAKWTGQTWWKGASGIAKAMGKTAGYLTGAVLGAVGDQLGAEQPYYDPAMMGGMGGGSLGSDFSVDSLYPDEEEEQYDEEGNPIGDPNDPTGTAAAPSIAIEPTFVEKVKAEPMKWLAIAAAVALAGYMIYKSKIFKK